MSAPKPLRPSSVIPPAPTPKRGTALRFSVDLGCQTLYYASNQLLMRRSIQVDDANTEEPQAEMIGSHAPHITCVSLSPNGLLCAAGDALGNVTIWSTKDTSTSRFGIHTCNPFQGSTILDVAWSDDSESIVAVGEGRGCFGAIYNLSNKDWVGNLNAHTQNILSCDYRKQRVVTGSADTTVAFFDGPPFVFQRNHKVHKGNVNVVRYSMDGTMIASSGADKTICLYDAQSGAQIGTIATGHTGSIYSLAFLRLEEGSAWNIVTASADKSCRIFAAQDGGALVAQFSPVTGCDASSLSIEHAQMGVGVGTWCARTVSVSLNGDIHAIAWAPGRSDATSTVFRGHQRTIAALASSGGHLFTCSVDGKVLRWKWRCFESASIDPRSAVPIPSGGTTQMSSAKKVCEHIATAVALADGRVLFAGHDESCWSGSTTGEDVTLHEKLPGSAIASTRFASTGVSVIATMKGLVFSAEVPERRRVVGVPYTPHAITAVGPDHLWVGACKDSNIYVYQWNESEGALKLIDTLTGVHRGDITTLCASPSGSLVAAGDSNREIIIWDAKMRCPLPRPRDMIFHASRVTTLAFLPPVTPEAEVTMLVSGSGDASVRVWSIHRKGETHLEIPRAHHSGTTEVLALSPTCFASGGADGAVRVWKLEDEHVRELQKG